MKFLAIGLVAGLFALPAFANTPTTNGFSGAPQDQLRGAAGPYTGDNSGDATLRPFQTQRPPEGDVRPLSGRHNSLTPPRMDANGVPNLRI